MMSTVGYRMKVPAYLYHLRCLPCCRVWLSPRHVMGPLALLWGCGTFGGHGGRVQCGHRCEWWPRYESRREREERMRKKEVER